MLLRLLADFRQFVPAFVLFAAAVVQFLFVLKRFLGLSWLVLPGCVLLVVVALLWLIHLQQFDVLVLLVDAVVELIVLAAVLVVFLPELK